MFHIQKKTAVSASIRPKQLSFINQVLTTPTGTPQRTMGKVRARRKADLAFQHERGSITNRTKSFLLVHMGGSA
ncbi:hypothetical protein B1222_11860 [Paenibacillus larvae subsp. pulvifaciens]|uniref:hypothetical protein n=1 Tax=Paenibacillus larvae TaxID=1464 RepID=UPI00098EC7D9|nr:hypothetical protein [Paenibacillus larvae]AQT84924.1 hypothetical protein B1222_11860 [Paenibacillus larvae subsp. pulvifaciens]AQZ46926.1 hypothetical protein B5S25_10295 [Paenibacillus larvae subsp. pulvifaciens]MBH0343039.1 hypothetical protein [Paenibacillus larvae]MCY7519902.1 hypothetical protein [Paenibacillus larvae]MCY9499830.1 hypothetical protein [Paenibacillus larvae]